MEEKKKSTATKGKAKATTGTKASEKKEIKKNESAQEQPNMEQMFQMFTMFMNQMQQQNEVKSEEKKEVKKKTVTKKTKSYLRKERGDEDVLVRSVAGTVCFKSPKTGITYNFLENGDEEWLSVDEVLQMETASKQYLHAPWLIVEDDEINEILGINKIADSVNKLNNIDEVLEDLTVGEIENLLNEATDDYRNTFSGIVINKIKEEELRDSVLIKELGRILKIDFDLYK